MVATSPSPKDTVPRVSVVPGITAPSMKTQDFKRSWQRRRFILDSWLTNTFPEWIWLLATSFLFSMSLFASRNLQSTLGKLHKALHNFSFSRTRFQFLTVRSCLATASWNPLLHPKTMRVSCIAEIQACGVQRSTLWICYRTDPYSMSHDCHMLSRQALCVSGK